MALTWLAYYPGDLSVSRLYAQLLSLTGSHQQSLAILDDLRKADPENPEILETLVLASQTAGLSLTKEISGSAHILSVDTSVRDSVPSWAYQIRQARITLDSNDLDKADEYIHQALLADPKSVLAGITHLRICQQIGLPLPSLQDIAAHYQKRWPTCLQISLIYADTLMDGSSPEQGVEIIHQATVQDVAGEVAQRHWGKDHPYRKLWPEYLNAPIDIPIPAEILSAIGWNRLPIGQQPNLNSNTTKSSFSRRETERNTQATSNNSDNITEQFQVEDHAISSLHKQQSIDRLPESLLPIQIEFERVAERLKQNHLARADGRFPLYILLTSRQGLKSFFGEQFPQLEISMLELVSAIRKRTDWGAELIYADDFKCLSAFDLKPAKTDDPWDLKLLLSDLDSSLSKRGEMIGAILIIGGPEIIPFHHLPNPVDDIDIDVQSDNPYATRDENYFIPEWLVGRVPCGMQRDIRPIQKILSNFAQHHSSFTYNKPWLSRWWYRVRNLIRSPLFPNHSHERPSWGSTAAIWRRASVSVFRPIGSPQALQVSPPAHVENADSQDDILPSSKLGYFNLHGLQEASEWFGQRDPSEPGDAPDYPIALRPQDVVNGGRAPKIVFTEACYGANITGKGIEESLALKFLASGTHVVVGSTSTAYGSIAPPLIAADLLGHTFWRYLRDGLAAGEAFKRAKIQVVREMHRRQGFLDGEDQKTLISFVLYGDPLAQLDDSYYHNKGVYRPINRPENMRTICDRDSGECRVVPQEQPIPNEVMAQVKHVVKQYLPGMEDAQVHISSEVKNCSNNCPSCPSSTLPDRHKGMNMPKLGRKVVTLSKEIASDPDESLGNNNDKHLVHRHYARMTLDNYGKLVKLTVSR